MKGFPVADCGSDHVPIVDNMKVRLRAMSKRKTVIKLQIDLLRSNNEHKKIPTANLGTHQRQRGWKIP